MDGKLPAWIARGAALALCLAVACTPAPAPGAGSGAAAKPAAAPSGQTAAPAAGSGLPSANPEWDRIVEEARKEGEVIVWGGNTPEAREFEKDAFEKAYPGIRVNLFQAPLSSDRDSRFIQEWQAGVARLDVLVTGSAGANARVKPLGALQDVRPFLRPEILDPATWRDGRILWVDKEHQYMLMSDTLVYPPVTVNATVQPQDLQRWEDLLDPKWKGKVVMQDPRQSGAGFAASLMMYYNPSLGPDFSQQFFGNSPVFSPDVRQNIEWTNAGRTLANIHALPREVESLNKEFGGTLRMIPSLTAGGKPVGTFLGSDGILFIPNLNPLPHPNATKVYVNWFYSRAGQQAMVDIVGNPSNRADVDLSKLLPITVPQPGVEYMNLNDEAYTGTDKVQAMRDGVSKWYVAP